MKYDLKFPSVSVEEKFHKVLSRLPADTRDRVMEAVEKLADEPHPYGPLDSLKLKPPAAIYQYAAQYRLRAGDYRVLYDVDTKRRIVWVLALRRRNEQTYK
jgi:mRNA-degrading endonuclease RelE of RelBE toxin-antitoxin system